MAYTPHRGTAPLVLGAIGVVFGDIGTSPLYALKEAFNPHYGIPLNEINVLGILSLLTWSMIWVIALKYLIVMMRADNNGEGGSLALLALALREVRREPRLKWAIISLGILGASMFYGDAMITPAISVLSAVEGLEVVTPAFAPYLVPIALGILTGLFVIQRHGTGKMGAFMGPITVVWFLAIAVAGIVQIVHNPSVLAAINPRHAVTFVELYPLGSFLVLGALILVVTGGEALYADMGHFGKKAIRIGWFGLVMPALLLNYYGQAAFVLANPAGIKNPFFLMLPQWSLVPMVVLATCATVIASQAVISGAFSVTRQAILLGYIPRLEILHTSSKEMGQIYVPFVNWSLFISVAFLIIGFQSSTALAGAYGIAVASTMAIEVLLAWVVARRIWKWSQPMTMLVLGSMLVVDLAFLSSNATKILSGGWFPIVIGAGIFTLLITWRRGRALMFQRMETEGIPLKSFVGALAASPPTKVDGTAIFMTATAETVPHALLHNLKHNRVLHKRTVFLTIVTHDVPVVPIEDRVQYERIAEGFYQVEAWYGFKEQPDIDEILNSCRLRYGLGFDLMDTSFFLSRETVIPAELPGMSIWRDHLFAWMSRNATRATDFFNIPANRVVELGTHVEI